MDFKQIRNIVAGSVGSFIVVMAAMYYLYPYVNPQAEIKQAEASEMEDLSFDPNKYGPKEVESLNQQIINLQKTIDSLKIIEMEYVSQIDSLNDYIVDIQQEKEEAIQEESSNIKAEDIKDVSRSLLNMDEDSLIPIVNLLDENQLVGLYNSANNMQRSKLLRSLEADKAAAILKKVME